jgi:hypothetical protein
LWRTRRRPAARDGIPYRVHACTWNIRIAVLAIDCRPYRRGDNRRSSKEPEQPEQIFLDFKDVEVATASFLRESVLAFRDGVRRRRSNLYPVIANVGDLVSDELKLLVTAQGNALMLCSLDDNDQPHEQRLLGELDPKQRITFDLVQKRGETDAAELMRAYGDKEKTKVQTA